jgi:hypothetical protein
VPPPEKPELPIPSPAASQRLPIMLAPAPATPQPEAGMNIPEVSRLDGAPPDPAGVDDGFAAKPESAVTLAVAEMMEARASESKQRRRNRPRPRTRLSFGRFPMPSSRCCRPMRWRRSCC